MTAKTAEWQLVTYDVWGNAEEGYEVNDVYPRGIHTLSIAPTDEEFLQITKDALGIECKCEIDGDDDCVWLTRANDNRPLCEFRRVID